MVYRFQLSQQESIAYLTSAEEVVDLLAVLERIAIELGWQPGDQLQAYQPIAHHIAVFVHETNVGGLQLVLSGSDQAMPYQRVWPEVKINADAAHVTILALKPEYRGHPNLFWSLCVEMWRFCREQGVRTIILEATPPTLRIYQRLGWPLEIIGDLRPHWGDDFCYLCQMDTDRVAQTATAKARRAQTYQKITAQAFRDEQFIQPVTAS